VSNNDKHEALLEAAGRMLRETDPLADPRWESLSAGTLGAADAATMRAEAERGGASEVAAVALEAFRPLDEAERHAVLGAALGATPAREADGAVDERGPAPQPGAPIPIRGRRRRFGPLLATLAPLAAAAAFVVVASMRPPALPEYGVTVEGGQSETRGSALSPSGAPVVLGPEARLRVLLRPATAVEAPIATRLYLVRDGRARSLDGATIRDVGEGLLVFESSRRELLPDAPPGDVALVFAIGRAGRVPDESEVAARTAGGAADAGDGALRLVVVRLQLER
jgi:hypothetical protein